MTPEGRVKAKVKRRLKALGTDCWTFMPVQKGMGIPALDFVLCIRGHFISIETKADATKNLTPTQLTTKAAIEAAGGLVFVVFDDNTLDYAMASITLLQRFGEPTYGRSRDAAGGTTAQTLGLDPKHLRPV